MKKRLMVLLLVPVLALSTLAVSCKNNTVNQDMILFSVFNGGFGTDWATHAAEEFNKTEEKYKVQIVPNDDEWYAIEAGFESGTAEYDIYLNSIDFIEANSRGWLEDLTDVYNSRPDGEDSDTVYEKVKDRDKDYVDTVHKYEGKYYTIPFQDGFMGFIYDHDIFLKNGFLIGRNGTPITSREQPLSLGRDGKEDTFDDGHPSNIAEYELMINKIQQTGVKVFQEKDEDKVMNFNVENPEFDKLSDYKKQDLMKRISFKKNTNSGTVAKDRLKLVRRSSRGNIVKKDGVTGWYFGRLE